MKYRKDSRDLCDAFISKSRTRKIILEKKTNGAGWGFTQSVVMKAALGAAIFAGEGGTMLWAESSPSGETEGGVVPLSLSTGTPVSAPAPILSQPQRTGAPSVQYDEVVVQGDSYKADRAATPKYTEPLRNVPQTITVVPKAVMQDQNATSLRDVLRNVPGISMQAGEGGVPAGDNLSVRGFNARTDIFIDGVRDFGGYSRDSFNLEQLEVSKGPSSSNAGRGSTGGSINQVSKAPGLENFVDGNFGVGNEEYKRATVDVNRALPNGKVPGLAMRLNALYHDAETPRRDEVRNNRVGFAPSLALGLGTPNRLTLSYFMLDQDNMPDYGIPWVPATNNALFLYRDKPAPVDPSNFYGLTTRDYEKTRTTVKTLQFERDHNERVTLRYLLRHGVSDRDSIVTAPRFVNDNTTNINRQMQSRLMVDTILANQLDVTSRFETFGLKHALVAGAELVEESSVNRTRVATHTVVPVADLWNPNPNQDYVNRLLVTAQMVNWRAKTTGLYAFDTIQIGDLFELTGGVRFDSLDTQYETVTASGTSTAISRVDKLMSGRAGLVFKPVDFGSIYAGYGTSFNPSSEGLSLTTTTALIDPEKSRTLELGTKWELMKRKLNLTAAVFRTEKTNTRTPGLPGEPSTVLSGEQRVDGVELGAGGNILRGWDIFSNYTFLKSEIVKSNTPNETGKELPQTPDHSFNVWTTYLVPAIRLQLGAGAQYVGRRFGNATNTRRVNDYWLLDLMAAYPIYQNVDLRLNIANAADEVYFDFIGGGHLIPGQGRLIVLSTNVKF